MAIFQLSPVKTALIKAPKSDVAGVDRGTVVATSYRETVKQTDSFVSSVKKTAEEGRYRRPPGTGMTRV